MGDRVNSTVGLSPLQPKSFAYVLSGDPGCWGSIFELSRSDNKGISVFCVVVSMCVCVCVCVCFPSLSLIK